MDNAEFRPEIKEKIHYQCNGQVPYCMREFCSFDGKGKCAHTEDIRYAKNFEKIGPTYEETSQSTFHLNILPKCINCPEFKTETIKGITYGEQAAVKVDIQIICAHRGLCDRLEQHLENIKDGQCK